MAADFGAGSDAAQEGVRALLDALKAPEMPEVAAARHRWTIALETTFGRDHRGLEKRLDALEAAYPAGRSGDRLELLFAVQTYYVLVVKFLIRQITPAPANVDSTLCVRGFPHTECPVYTPNPGSILRPILSDPFAWYTSVLSQPVQAWLQRVAALWGQYDFHAPVEEAGGSGDLLKALYQEVFPKRLRHVLGEYYTPDWLVEQMLDDVGYTAEPGGRLLDPACGSGGFLVSAIRRLRARWEDGHGRGETRETRNEGLRKAILARVVGIDLNPLAVVTARANYLMAIRDLLPGAGGVEVPVFVGDSILGRHEGGHQFEERFDYVVGNPPWIAWDDLPPDARQATKPLWQHYGLFSLSGSDARHGGGKKDLSMLMIYAAADRYLKPSGRLAMVVTQTVFQTRGAGDGFRRFRLGKAGESLRIERVDDLVALRPFPSTANWTATLVLQKGSRTTYPVPYVKHAADGTRRALDAVPIDPARPTSPWFLRPRGWTRSTADLVGPSDYEAHLGANTGGANGVYWMTLCDRGDRDAGTGLIRVRNIAQRGKRPVASVEHDVEAELLYPLLRWADVARFRALPAGYLLLAQDVHTRRGIAEPLMRRRYPKAYAYLSQFRGPLEHRAAYRRYQSRAAFYSMYDVGPYTVAPVKVVWRRMDRRIHAAVVEPVDDPRLGPRPVVPQETCVLVAVDSADEAHYLCAVLNSALVGFLVASHSVCGGKSFGSPGMLDFLPIRRYDPANSTHRELAEASRQAHCLTASGNDGASVQDRIDRLSAGLWGIGPDEYNGVLTVPAVED